MPAHGVTHPIALGLGTHQETRRERVLQSETQLAIGLALTRLAVAHTDSARAAEVRARLGVVGADTAEQSPAFAQRQCAHEIKVSALHSQLRGQGARRHGVHAKAKLAEIEIAQFKGHRAVELIAAKDLVGGVFLVARYRGDPKARAGQCLRQAGVVDLRPRLAGGQTEVGVTLLSQCRQGQQRTDAAECEHADELNVFHELPLREIGVAD